MKSSVKFRVAYAACLAVVIAAMGLVSWQVIRLDRERAEARQQGEREEKIRTALWRMDAALNSVVAEEGSLRLEVYTPEAHAPAQAASQASEPSLVRLRFRIEPDGGIVSPAGAVQANAQEPQPAQPQAIAGRQGAPQQRPALPGRESEMGQAAQDDQQQAATIGPGDLVTLNSSVNQQWAERNLPPLPAQSENGPQFESGYDRYSDYSEPEKANASAGNVKNGKGSYRGQQEYQVRQKIAQQSVGNRQFNESGWLTEAQQSAELRQGWPRGVWIDGRLIIARQVARGQQVYVAGTWLDFEALQTWLTGMVADLLPDARIEPASGDPAGDESRRLAALPLRLAPGHVAVAEPDGASPVIVMLLVAWAALLLAAGAVDALIRGIIALGERRARFVTAVTHELRTPLTSMQMYTEMMAAGMVADEEKRDSYVRSLHAETGRLCRLVENVLTYARQEAGRKGTRPQPVALDDLLARLADRLAQRAELAEMELVVDAGPAEGAMVRADATAVEQILFNLVDNAAKYARSADDRRVHLEVAVEAKRTRLRVRDHGPGVPAGERKEIFQAFRKARRDEPGTAGGVGLGLSICRRAARRMGGDLALVDCNGGACFELTLPNA